jgi:hypothetical protein
MPKVSFRMTSASHESTFRRTDQAGAEKSSVGPHRGPADQRAPSGCCVQKGTGTGRPSRRASYSGNSGALARLTGSATRPGGPHVVQARPTQAAAEQTEDETPRFRNRLKDASSADAASRLGCTNSGSLPRRLPLPVCGPSVRSTASTVRIPGAEAGDGAGGELRRPEVAVSGLRGRVVLAEERP